MAGVVSPVRKPTATLSAGIGGKKCFGSPPNVEAVQQQFGHGGVIVHRAGLIDLAIETLQRRRVVVLHIDEGEDVADGIRDGQIGAELAAIAGIAGRESACLRAPG